MDLNLSKLWEVVEVRGPWHAAVHGSQRVGQNLVTRQQQSSSIPLRTLQQCSVDC